MSDKLKEFFLETHAIEIAEDIDVSVNVILNKYKSQFIFILEKQGFTNIKFIRKKKLLGLRYIYPTGGQPNASAERNGKKAWIFFSEIASFIMEVDAMTMDQYEYAEKHHDNKDIYYALFYKSSKNNDVHYVNLTNCVKMSTNGKWLLDNPIVQQFIPFEKTKCHNRYAYLLGGGALFKLSVLIPAVYKIGRSLNFNIKGLTEEAGMDEEYVVYGIGNTPMLQMLLKSDRESGTLYFVRPFFYWDGDPCAELEIVDFEDNAEEDILITVMDLTGREFKIECMESLMCRSLMKVGQRFKWTLSMVAEKCTKNKPYIVINSGPFFEMEKAEFKEKNGCEPPEDFSVKIFTENMRSLMEDENVDSGMIITGSVENISRKRMDFMEFTVLRILCIPDNEEVYLNVFVADHVLGDCVLRVGDNVSCSGYVCGAPDSLIQDGESWQDSPEVAWSQEKRDSISRGISVFYQYSDLSLAVACVAKALLEKGWNIISGDDRILARDMPTFIVENQLGEINLVLVDAIIDGHQAQFSYAEQILGEFEKIGRKQYGDGLCCYHFKVSLNYDEKVERYGISLETIPEFPEQLSMPRYVAPAFSPTILSVDEGEVAEKRQYPEVLNEKVVSALFCRAIQTQDWGIFSKWLREEVIYTSNTVGMKFSGKIDFVRYMYERQEMWEEKGLWEKMFFETGSLLVEEKRRPCCMTIVDGEMTAGVTFVDFAGLIGEIVVQPKDIYDTYERDC